MRQKFLRLLLLVAVAFPSLVLADPSAYVTGLTNSGTPMILSKSGKKLILGNEGTDGVQIQVAKTPVAVFNASGMTLNSGGSTVAPFTATPAATPVQASNYCPTGICVVPTAAANAAVYLGAAATPTAGGVYKVFNSNAANAIRLKAAGAAKINGSGSAGNYFSVLAQTAAECYYADNVTAACAPVAAVTPAGP